MLFISLITKMPKWQQLWVRKCERNSPENPKVSAEGGRECSRCRTEATCSPRGAHGGTGYLLAAHGCHAEQMFTCSYEGAHSAAVAEAWRRNSSWESLSSSSPRPELQPTERSQWWSRRVRGAAICGDICWRNLPLKGGPCGIEPCWSNAWRAAACEKPTQDHFGNHGILWERPHME